ncbi:superfamily I DNA/RNA helicase [Priestia aryabhattai]|uniref:hypothetical protein n=1 Tax=Priestia aryabhattai TaxID=412384 RepID=UPI0027E48F48|nr:hypothetical protein [Priestia aryabhattai]MDP9726953.1 superfamily I DNA/RNA helicase [Priestia aryabhattai]
MIYDKDELLKEFKEGMEDLGSFFGPYLIHMYTLETNLDKILELMVEVERSMSSFGDMTDADIANTLREEIDEVKKYIFAMSNKARRLAKIFKVDLDSKKLKIEKIEDIVALLEQSNRLNDELVTAKMVELDLLRDNFEDINEMEPVAFLTDLLSHLTEFADAVGVLEGCLEENLDFEIEEIDDREERLQKGDDWGIKF